MSVIKSFPDRYASKVATILMLDEEINKMLYYNDKNDVDIYTLPRAVSYTHSEPTRQAEISYAVFCLKKKKKIKTKNMIVTRTRRVSRTPTTNKTKTI